MDKNNISINLKRVKKLLKSVDKNHAPVAKMLYERIEFMTETLIFLEEKIKNEGAVIEQKNGNGFLVKMENPAQKSYNTTIGRYNAAMKTLSEMIPESEQKDDEFMAFIKGDKP